jgi:hypothetical protein
MLNLVTKYLRLEDENDLFTPAGPETAIALLL